MSLPPQHRFSNIVSHRQPDAQVSLSSVGRSRTIGSKQKSIKKLKTLLVAALLPVAGAVGQQAAGGGSPYVQEDDDEPSGVYEKGIEMGDGLKQQETEVIEPDLDEIPRCRATPVTFDDLCVDVSVIDISKQTKWNTLNTVFNQLGLGRKAAMVNKRILHNISGTIEPGKLVALMGSSGAGKSTLLNVLSRGVIPSNGIVRYGDVLITDTIVQSCSAYIQQLDLFLNHLSVHEHLQCQIRLRLPELRTREERDKLEETICNHLNLAKCRNNRIGTSDGYGGISGGERKRLNVASELLTQPAVLFADEPTTGLDSFMAESLIKTLRKLANSGRTVIATIHQPNAKIFNMFDEVLLLAEGRLIYFGECLGAIEWFKCLDRGCPPYTNPADFIVKVLSMPEAPVARKKKLNEIIAWSEKWKKEGFEFLNNWRAKGRKDFSDRSVTFLRATTLGAMSKNSIFISKKLTKLLDAAEKTIDDEEEEQEELIKEKINEPLQTGGGAVSLTPGENATSFIIKERLTLSWFSQVGILFKRAMNANRRDPVLLQSRALQTFILSLLYGLVIFRLSWSLADTKTRIGCAFCVIVNQSTTGAYAVVDTFTFEKPIIQREYESGLISPTAYITAKMLADVPLQVLFPTIFCTIVWWMCGLNDDYVRCFIAIGIVLLTSNTAMSVGYLASAISPNADIAAVILDVVFLPLTVFCGFHVKLDDVPKWISWLQYTSFLKYGFSNILVAIFRGEFVDHPTQGKLDGLKVIDELLGIKDNHYALWFVMLVVLFIVYRLLCFIAFPLSLRFNKENN